MSFDKESAFEDALIALLSSQYGWERDIIKNPTEEDLIDNWARILFDNNRERDRLNNQPLTNGEMQQIIEQIANLRTPLKLNGFINGKTMTSFKSAQLIANSGDADKVIFLIDRIELGTQSLKEV